MRSSPLLAVGATVFVALSVAVAFAQRGGVFRASRDHPAIEYGAGPLKDRVSELNREIQDGTVRLRFDEASGYLRSTLEAFDVPIESQVVVFSRTSFQAQRIDPSNPRAIFFNDRVAVGWVRGGEVLEVAAQDPQQGVIFYSLSQVPADKPQFARNENCLSCHLSWDTLGVPGLFVLSTFPMPDDKNAYAAGGVSDHRSRFDERWGGWYVTGHAGSVQHMGNITRVDSAGASLSQPPVGLDALEGVFDTKGYLSRYSDVVALMVLEHQTHMINLITRIGWETRLALYQERMMNTVGDAPRDRGASAAAIRDSAAELVDYLLFVDEAPFAGRIQSSSGFAEKFSAQGPRDSKGRSLRELDLERQLMRYPCSYMIYSEAFDALPAIAKDAIYERMWQILSGQERHDSYSRLSPTDRQAIVEIVRDTKKGLPDYFRPVTR